MYQSKGCSMFHLAAFFQNFGAAQVNTSMAALSDGIIPIANGHFIPYKGYDLIAAYVSGLLVQRARLNSGTIRQINPTYIRPINQALLPANNPNLMLMPQNPFAVIAHEELALEVSTTTAVSENDYGLIWLQSQYQSPPQGRTYNIRLTSTGVAVASTWTGIAYTLETALPAGQYAVVGGELQSTTCIGWRLTFDNQVERPGWLGQASLGNRLPYDLYYGGFGQWGTFFTYSLPRLEVLCNAADAAFEGYLEVVRIPGGMVQ